MESRGSTPTKTYKVKVVADSTDMVMELAPNKYQFLKSDGATGFGTNGVDLDLQEVELIFLIGVIVLLKVIH